MKIKIGNKIVGDGQPFFLIAEVGINHNGDINLAKKLVDVAKNAGVDAVKFQTYKAEGVVTNAVELPEYAKKNIGTQQTQQEMIKNTELNYGEFIRLKEYCDMKEIIFLSTPHSLDAVDFLEDLVPAYKIGSGDLTNFFILELVAQKRKPMILGTGMATMHEVKEAVHVIHQSGNNEIILLHSTTNYPCSLGEVNLKAMNEMKKELGCLVGYSDHTLGITVPIMAASLGAVIIEKHITVDRDLPGPDHKASLTPNELRHMVNEIRNVETALGSTEKKPADSEKQIMTLIRKSIIATIDIEKGSVIQEHMLTIKRPGTGVPPFEIGKILGKKAIRHISQDEIIQLDMVEPI